MRNSDDEIFCRAIEMDTVDLQNDFVNQHCLDDDQRGRVLRLLQSHRLMKDPSTKDRASVLDRAEEVFHAFADSEDVKPGSRIGDYVLVEKIGEGGVGLVYQARQIDQEDAVVALKLLKPGMDSQRVLARFALERQVLQQMDHEGITQILDAGIQHNGRPYFAMELVPDALTITEYCNRFELGLRERIELIVAVCEVVQYAHQRGIIHRDLKPSNILIPGKTESGCSPKVIDFGIAKILKASSEDSRTLTQIGERFGTPQYMSPEQALSPTTAVDIRSDIYSIGVILYELLVGKPPRDQGSVSTNAWTSENFWKAELPFPSHSVSKQSQSEKATEAKTQSRFANSELRGELDWITLKALEHQRERRYQTVAEMQRDLELYLAGEPIAAASPSVTYRLRKTLRKHWIAVSVVAVFLLTIISTSVLTTTYALRASKAEEIAQNRLTEVLAIQQELTTQRDRAELAKYQAQSLLRVFQVQTVTTRTLANHSKAVLGAIMSPEKRTPEAVKEITESMKSDVLVEPHSRLMIKGDWKWASSPFPDELISESIRLTSQEASQALGETRTKLAAPNQPTPQPNSEFPNRNSFQVMLLSELKNMLPDNDPFIAEVLDNCGLNASERGDFEQAIHFLSESVKIWEQLDQHIANCVQSRLFLAEAFLKQGSLEKAKQQLRFASEHLQSSSLESQHAEPLHSFLRSLNAQSASQQDSR